MDLVNFHSIERITMEVNRAHQLLGFRHSPKYLLLCSAEDRNGTKIQTGLEQLEGE